MKNVENIVNELYERMDAKTFEILHRIADLSIKAANGTDPKTETPQED